MIPLGSCTMKLNATTEMLPVTWPEFARIHPFAPAEQSAGYREMFDELEPGWPRSPGSTPCRCSPTPVRRVSTRACWRSALPRSRGDDTATSASSRLRPRHQPGQRGDGGHAGRRRRATTQGNIDIDDLRGKATNTRRPRGADDHLPLDARRVRGGDQRDLRPRPRARRPGVPRRRQPERAGRTGRPGDIGADVCHLNLHKTFCIPHGGGGPGMGPIGVAEHLAPFLPGHPVLDRTAPVTRSVRSRRRRTAARASCRSRGCTSR